MRRSSVAKFPHSVQLFKFCHKVLTEKTGTKIHDQQVGSILDFNPSDCSHWKRGEKNVKSVFALEKLSAALEVDSSLIHDIASGQMELDEAFFEFKVSKLAAETATQVVGQFREEAQAARERVVAFVDSLQDQAEFSTPPLYTPEIMRYFSFISTQPVEIMDRLSRILRTKPGQYTIQYRKGDLMAQTRLSIIRDLGKILFQGERQRFPELGTARKELVAFEEWVFASSLLVPKQMLLSEMSKLDSRKNMVAELAAVFWVPKSLISFQLQDLLRWTTPETAAAEVTGVELQTSA